MTPFVIYQGAWNVMERSFEREIIPMARSEGDYRFVPRKTTDVRKNKAWLLLLGAFLWVEK
jgi:hypothetical protein